MGLTGDDIRAAREAAGLSIAEAARALKQRSTQPLPDLESIVRSWKRWERGTEPSRFYQPLIECLLGLGESQSEHAPVALTGEWWAAWQSSLDGAAFIAVQPVQFDQQVNDIRLKALQRGRPIDQGGYLWRGELRLWDNEILMGWYVAEDGSVRSKGVIYFVLHPQGQRMTGRWVGLSWDGDTMTGLAAMARTEENVKAIMNELTDKECSGRTL